jgi:pimeloyl-ACP methyl ester carboxylesterase
MTIRFTFLRALPVSLLISVLIGCASVLTQSPAEQQVDPAVAKLGKGFVSNTAAVNGTTLHYVRGGTGPAVILLHGFPQDWYEFHQIMPRLAKRFTVVAVDLRGVGRSAATPGGYDAANMADDIDQLARQLTLERVYVVGHDIGGTVAYAFARLHPKALRGVMILDVPLPGIEPWEEAKADPRLWHIGFHQTPGLPEQLIAGRQFVYFREFFNRGTLSTTAISDADVAHYASAYGAPAQLRAGMEFYRAFPASERFNATQRSAIDVPIVLAGGDKSFGRLNPRVAEALRAHGCASVHIEVIKNSGHYVADEQPEIVAELIERYASS